MSLEFFRFLSLILATWGAVLSTINYLSARSSKIEAKVVRRPTREGKTAVVVLVYGRGARSFVEDISWSVRLDGKLKEVHRKDVLEFCSAGATQKHEWDASSLQNEETVLVKVRTGGGRILSLSSRDPDHPRFLKQLWRNFTSGGNR